MANVSKKIRRVILSLILGALTALLGACTRIGPCEGNTCGGNGICRVEVAPETEGEKPFERYHKEKLVEVCDCNGKAGFEFREIGCGPAGAFKSCMPERCENFVNRCDFDEVCIDQGPETAPICRKCEEGKVPRPGRLGCEYALCAGLELSCPDQEACQADGNCGFCLSDEVFDENTRTCRPCPEGFIAENGNCSPQPKRAYLATRLQILKQNRIDVFGALNENGFFREYWYNETDDGYNMIWDQDLLLVMLFPELTELTDDQIPVKPIETQLEIFNGLFVTTDIWEEYRGEPEPTNYRDARRPSAVVNYRPGALTGEECAKAVGTDCNPGHFRGDDLLRAKYNSDFECSPKLASLKVSVSQDKIESIGDKAWLVMPYEQSDLLLQAYQLKLLLERKPTGLCSPEEMTDGWPCTGYVGTLTFALRAVELIDSFRKSAGGGISEDFFVALLGDPDVDQDDDGFPDSYSLQVDIDLAPARFMASTETSTLATMTSTSP